MAVQWGVLGHVKLYVPFTCCGHGDEAGQVGSGKTDDFGSRACDCEEFFPESVSLLKKQMAPYTGTGSVTLQSRKRRRRCGLTCRFLSWRIAESLCWHGMSMVW